MPRPPLIKATQMPVRPVSSDGGGPPQKYADPYTIVRHHLARLSDNAKDMLKFGANIDGVSWSPDSYLEGLIWTNLALAYDIVWPGLRDCHDRLLYLCAKHSLLEVLDQRGVKLFDLPAPAKAKLAAEEDLLAGEPIGVASEARQAQLAEQVVAAVREEVGERAYHEAQLVNLAVKEAKASLKATHAVGKVG